MRIQYFADTRFPIERANGIQTMQTCHALAERGHRLTLVVRPDTARPPRDPFAFYGLPVAGGLSIARVRVAGPPPARRLQYLAAALLRALGSGADAVVTRDLGVASLLLRASRGRRVPLLYESHGFAPIVTGAMPDLLSGGRPATAAKARRLTRRERCVWRRAAGYVTITRALADELAARFGPRPRVAVIPDGVRLPADRVFTAPRRTDAPVVVYAGHLYPWKGVGVLLEALATLHAARGLIVGGHPGETDLESTRTQAARLGLADRVRFTGAVAPAGVAARLAEADVLVLPNTATALSARYSSPLKLFEYLAAGRPIVASDLPAIREVLEDGRNALLVEPGDARSMAAAIRRLAGDHELAGRLARQAFDAAREYTWAKRAERYEALLDEVCGTS